MFALLLKILTLIFLSYLQPILFCFLQSWRISLLIFGLGFFVMVKKEWIFIGKIWLISVIVLFVFLGGYSEVPNYFETVNKIENTSIENQSKVVLLKNIRIPKEEQIYKTVEREEERSGWDFQQRVGESEQNYRRRVSGQSGTITMEETYGLIPIYKGNQIIALGIDHSNKDWSDYTEIYLKKIETLDYQESLILSDHPEWKDLYIARPYESIYLPIWKLAFMIFLPILFPMISLLKRQDLKNKTLLDVLQSKE